MVSLFMPACGRGLAGVSGENSTQKPVFALQRRAERTGLRRKAAALAGLALQDGAHTRQIGRRVHARARRPVRDVDCNLVAVP